MKRYWSRVAAVLSDDNLIKELFKVYPTLRLPHYPEVKELSHNC